MAVAPFSQRIQRGSQIGVGNGSIEESIDQSILPDNHHPVRQFRIDVFITQQHELAARHHLAYARDQLQAVFQRVGGKTADLHQQNIRLHGPAE